MMKPIRFALAVALVTNVATSFANGQEKDGAIRAPQGQRMKAQRPGMSGGGGAFRTARNPVGQEPPVDMSCWGLGPQEARVAESQDVIVIASHMYGLSHEEAMNLEKSIATVQESRWPEQGEDKYDVLLQRRAELFNKITSGRGIGPDSAGTYKLLNDNAEFVQANQLIAELEVNRPLNFSTFVPAIESNISPHLVDIARANWATSAAILPVEQIRNKTLAAQVSAGSYDAMIGATSATHPWVSGVDDAKRRYAMERAAGIEHNQKAVKVAEPTIQPKPVALGGQPAAKPVARATPPAMRPAKAAPPPVAKPTPAPRVPTVPPRPLSEWEKYVLDFIEKHQLTETQKNAAMAILRDVTARANQIQLANESRKKSIDAMQDPKAKNEKMKELNAPIDGLFERLRVRLENLLTAQQRDLGSAPAKPKR